MIFKLYVLLLVIFHVSSYAEHHNESYKITVYDMNKHHPLENIRSFEYFTPKRIKVSTLDDNATKDLIKFTLEPGDIVHNGNRTELTIKDFISEKCDMKYNFDFLLPTNFRSETDWQIIIQWHDQPNTKQGEKWLNHKRRPPVLALHFADDQIYLIFRPTTGRFVMSDKRKVKVGQWHNLQFNIVWSSNSSGKIEAKFDGNHLLNNSGSKNFNGSNIYNSVGNYLKFGLYRGPGSKSVSSIFFKNVSILAHCIQ